MKAPEHVTVHAASGRLSLTWHGGHTQWIDNATLKVAEHRGGVVFLHEVVPGIAERSYGLQVARLAGLPASVVTRAGSILKSLEKSQGGRSARARIDDLPLFATLSPPPPPEPPAELPEDKLALLLDAIDPDALTPREALEALYRLKREREESRVPG